jgi:hypothetical protein
MLGELDGGLPAKLHHHAPGLFGFEQRIDIFRGERIEVKAVGGIKIGGNRFGVVVGNDRVVTQLAQRPDTVHRAVVKFDALPDADRAGTEHDDLLLILVPFSRINSAASFSSSKVE